MFFLSKNGKTFKKRNVKNTFRFFFNVRFWRVLRRIFLKKRVEEVQAAARRTQSKQKLAFTPFLFILKEFSEKHLTILK